MAPDVIDLRHHGDVEVGPGLVDLAVNVRRRQPPPWLRLALLEALDDVAAYPDATAATAAVAVRHEVDPAQVLVTAGGAEAFTLLARALPARGATRAVVVHPQFTEPEQALRVAGHVVTRVVLLAENGFALDPSAVPDDAGLVVIGNPTNPTSVLHRRQTLTALARPGRVLCVDEAFMDAVPGETETLAGADVPGLVVVRSLTKTWGIAGLRAGYVVGDAAVVAAMRAQQPPWSVGSLALAATVACCSDRALREAELQAREGISHARLLATALRGLAGRHHVRLPVEPAAPFVLVNVADGERIRWLLRRRGWAIRSGSSFPGLGADWWRVAARDALTTMRFSAELGDVLSPPAVAGSIGWRLT